MNISRLSLLGSLLAVPSCNDQSNTTGNHAHTPPPPAAQGTFISAGAATACTISAAATLYCWGLNEDGEDGTGFHAGGTFDPTPVAVPSDAHFKSVSNSRSDFITVVSTIDNDARGFTCGVATDGTAYAGGKAGQRWAEVPDAMNIPSV